METSTAETAFGTAKTTCPNVLYISIELIFVLSGGLKVSLYTELDEILSEFTILVGDVLICLAGGHGYEVLEDGTKILEIKNGPYFGTEVDRRRI